MRRRLLLVTYLALLVVSASLTWPRPAPLDHLASTTWGSDSSATPVLLLHGSPGSRSNFDALGPRLASSRPAIALDLPGFGDSTGHVANYGAEAASKAALAELDRLGLDRVHVVGWSWGSAVALHMASGAPDRIESVTMLGGIGVQEVEGSGDHTFEHLKYLVSAPFVVGLPELVPHFGLFGHWTHRWAFIRSFIDLDQRPMRALMETLDTPVLILHGRDDFLVPARAALVHHDVLPASRLELVDGSHFLPFTQVESTATRLESFMASVEEDTFAPAARLESSPLPTWRALGARVGVDLRTLPVLVLILVIALFATFFEDLVIVLAGLLVAAVELDLGVAFAGIGAGMLLEASGLVIFRRTDPLAPYWRARIERLPIRTGLGARFQRGRCESQFRSVSPGFAIRHLRWLVASVLGGVLKALLGLVLVGILANLTMALDGWMGAALGVLATLVLFRFLVAMTTRIGRSGIRALPRRLHHEFWPWWLFYLPLVVWLPLLAIRHRGALVWTAVNPAISHGGGVVGESKASILRHLDHPRILPWIPIPAGPDPATRAREAASRMPFDFPAIAKPDSGQRGFAVSRVRDEAGLERYLRTMTNVGMVQRLHEGPEEVGVLWIRDVGVFSITRKILPVIEGDGRRTLEALLFRDRRRCIQAPVFLERFGSRAFDVPDGTVPLGDAANHVQGARLEDGSALVEMFTPLVDDVMKDHDDLDVGRFDIRYRTIEDAGIIEFNGTTSESTNIYDPDRTIVWAWGVLLRHWSHLYRLGARRRAEGVRPMRPLELWRTWTTHRDSRTGSSRSS